MRVSHTQSVTVSHSHSHTRSVILTTFTLQSTLQVQLQGKYNHIHATARCLSLSATVTLCSLSLLASYCNCHVLSKGVSQISHSLIHSSVTFYRVLVTNPYSLEPIEAYCKGCTRFWLHTPPTGWRKSAPASEPENRRLKDCIFSVYFESQRRYKAPHTTSRRQVPSGAARWFGFLV